MSSSPPSPARSALTTKRILITWWPLAASWLLMTAEQPLMSAVIARLVNPEVNLAAWGIVFAISIIMQSPTTMLLAASTALSKNWEAYKRLRRFTIGVAAFMTGLHALVAFTPLYYVVVRDLIGAPAELLEPARLGLMIMTPWAAGTGYRRFEQGVLIRFNHSRTVVWGSVLRVTVDSLLLVVGYSLGSIPGVVVAAGAIIVGVISEAIYAYLRVRPLHHTDLRQAPADEAPLTFGAFLKFYLPLAATTLLTFVVQPLVSAALSRMPNALESLAVWPVVLGLLVMWQSFGIAHNEVVIALLDEVHAVRILRRFTVFLVVGVTLLLLFMAVTPLATLWFNRVAALPPRLVDLASAGLWLGLLLPGLRILQSWYQGVIVYSRQTRSITESVVVYLAAVGVVLGAGIVLNQVTGLYVGLAAISAGFLIQDLWLWLRSRATRQALQVRDETKPSFQAAGVST